MLASVHCMQRSPLQLLASWFCTSSCSLPSRATWYLVRLLFLCQACEHSIIVLCRKIPLYRYLLREQSKMYIAVVKVSAILNSLPCISHLIRDVNRYLKGRNVNEAFSVKTFQTWPVKIHTTVGVGRNITILQSQTDEHLRKILVISLFFIFFIQATDGI